MDQSGQRPAAAERAQWLAELAAAVDEAQQIARAWSVSQGNCAEADEAYRRLDAVRIELENLRRGGWCARPAHIDPHWTSLFPGARGAGI